jgi:hypothetical protein
VRSLSARMLLDSAMDDLEALSTSELQQIVRRAVVGPRTWDPESEIEPTVSRRVAISFLGHNDHLRSSSTHRWLAGYRYIALSFWKFGIPRPQLGLRCWNVHTGQLVWVWERPGHTTIVPAFDFCGDGSEAVVSILSETTTLVIQCVFRIM